MNRRFSVPSAQPPHRPQPRIQHLPDDFASFLPSGLVRRNPSASPEIAQDILAPMPQPLALQSHPTPSHPASSEAQKISCAPASPEPAPVNVSGLAHARVSDSSPELAPPPSPPRPILPAPASEISAPEEVFFDEVPHESWAESLPSDSFLSSISELLGPEAGAELAAVLRPRGPAPFNAHFDSLSEMHYPDSSAPPPQSRPPAHVAAAPSPTSVPQNAPSRKFQKTARKRKVADLVVPSLGLHRRKCIICNHPERDMIEMYFIQWRSAHRIASDFDLSGTSVVYRHANALGLFAKRSRSIRSMLEIMFERVADVTPTADALIRAVRTYASLTDDGKWVEPATTHLVTTSTVLPGLPAPVRANPASIPAPPAPSLASSFAPVSESLPSLPTFPSSPIFEIPILAASSDQLSEPPHPVASNRECSPIKKHRKPLKKKESAHV